MNTLYGVGSLFLFSHGTGTERSTSNSFSSHQDIRFFKWKDGEMVCNLRELGSKNRSGSSRLGSLLQELVHFERVRILANCSGLHRGVRCPFFAHIPFRPLLRFSPRPRAGRRRRGAAGDRGPRL